jgi:hypothetical protein
MSMLPNEFHPGPRCACNHCLANFFSPFQDGEAIASKIPQTEDTFAKAMARVEELREANNERLSKRDRAEWDCFFHFACQNSLLIRQAE